MSGAGKDLPSGGEGFERAEAGGGAGGHRDRVVVQLLRQPELLHLNRIELAIRWWAVQRLLDVVEL